MTVINQIIASLRDEPEKWKWQANMNGDYAYREPPDKPSKTVGMENRRMIDKDGNLKIENYERIPTTVFERFRLRRAVRKWQRRVR